MYVECVNLKENTLGRKKPLPMYINTCIKERECVCISSMHNRVKAIEYTST